MTENKIKENVTEIHKWFYRYRNGAVAETLIKSGLPYKRIFGLLIPQLSEISNYFKKDLELARELWKDDSCRESRLLAIYLLPSELISKDEILPFIETIKTKEEAELLPFKVLKRLPYSKELFEELSGRELYSEGGNQVEKHFIQMFKKNLGL